MNATCLKHKKYYMAWKTSRDLLCLCGRQLPTRWRACVPNTEWRVFWLLQIRFLCPTSTSLLHKQSIQLNPSHRLLQSRIFNVTWYWRLEIHSSRSRCHRNWRSIRSGLLHRRCFPSAWLWGSLGRLSRLIGPYVTLLSNSITKLTPQHLPHSFLLYPPRALHSALDKQLQTRRL